jgi:hypothetical protein
VDTEKKMYKYKLLGGNHVEPNPDPNAKPDENNERGISFNKGDIIVTPRQLDKIFGKNKFERIYSDEQLRGREVTVTETPPVPNPEDVIQPDPPAMSSESENKVESNIPKVDENPNT